MCKTPLRGKQMPASVYVEETIRWAKAAVRDEARFPGDYKPAVERVARKAGVSRGLLWSLLYRPPKSIAVEAYEALAIYTNEQERKYRQERAEVAPKTRLGRLLVRAADALVGEDDGGLK